MIFNTVTRLCSHHCYLISETKLLTCSPIFLAGFLGSSTLVCSIYCWKVFCYIHISYFCLSIYWLMDILLFGYCAVNISVHVFLETYIFISPGFITRSEMAGSYSSFKFNIFRNHLSVFQSGNTILHSY